MTDLPEIEVDRSGAIHFKQNKREAQRRQEMKDLKARCARLEKVVAFLASKLPEPERNATLRLLKGDK